MPIRIEQIELFLALSEMGSFTAVADKLERPQPTVSRQIKLLEDELGLRLLDRKQRQVKLTEFGHSFLDHAKRIQAAHQNAMLFAEGSRSKPSGHLQLETLPGIASTVLSKFETEFSAKYPEISLGINTIRPSEGDKELTADVRIHLSLPKDESLVARPLCQIARNFFASPEFVQQYGPFNHPRDLLGVPCIQLAFAQGQPESWFFVEGDQTFPLEVAGAITVDMGYLAILGGINGLGAIWLGETQVVEEIESGKLVRLFEQDFAPHQTLYIIYRGRQYQPQKERVFIEAIVKHFKVTHP
ncbi:LysR family transcriptional regulator [Corallincola platygyrae]|uniref:LysR family transcriptional regulator n=1 Tax=Corallincola platygyrae TaxID=1193278 RepID=A0ABW4XKP3_9GAMM